MRWRKSSPSRFGMALPRSGRSGLQSEERRCVREEGGGGYGRAYAGVLAVKGGASALNRTPMRQKKKIINGRFWLRVT